jgi:putative flavoprotein involved in K+ transport
VTQPSERFDVVVVGGGQAGLATGFHLARRNVDFVILDAYPRAGESWRKRWNSLRLFTPARLDALPGMRFPAKPGALPSKDEMAAYLEKYVEHHKLPVWFGIRVESISRDGDHYVLVSGDRRFEANQVVVATGGHPTPKRPDFADGLDPTVKQLHSAEYRDPSQLQAGDVLVIGAGNSGAEIAMDAVRDHRVWLAGRPTGRRSPLVFSRPMWWLGNKLLTVDRPGGRKAASEARNKGTPLVRVTEQDLAAAKVTRVPRVEGVDSGKPRLEDGRRLEVKNVVWCTGFKHDYSWIKLPATAGGHLPAHERGVVGSEPGLYFVGLPFQYGLNSALIDGVNRDADFVVARIAAQTQTKPVVV